MYILSSALYPRLVPVSASLRRRASDGEKNCVYFIRGSDLGGQSVLGDTSSAPTHKKLEGDGGIRRAMI